MIQSIQVELNKLIDHFIPYGREINTKLTQDFLFQNNPKGICYPIFSYQVYLDIYYELKNGFHLWITNDLDLIKSLFIEEIQSGYIKIIDDDKELSIETAVNIKTEPDNMIYIIHHSFAEQHKIIYIAQWDSIIIHTPLMTNPYRYSQVKKYIYLNQSLWNNIIWIGDKKILRYIKKFIPSLSIMSYHNKIHNSQMLSIIITENYEEKMNKLLEFIRERESKGILIVSSPKDGEYLEYLLSTSGINVIYFHNNLSLNDKLFSIERFQSSDHLNPLQILIVSEFSCINPFKINIQWIVHYQFSDGWIPCLSEIISCLKQDKIIDIYLFYSYQDRCERELNIIRNLPDSKNIRILCSILKKHRFMGQSCFISQKHLYNSLRVPHSKLENILQYIINTKAMSKGVSILSTVHFIYSTKGHMCIDNNYLWLKDLLKNTQGYFDVLANCKERNLSPIIVSKILYELDKQGYIIILEKDILYHFVLMDNFEKLKLRRLNDKIIQSLLSKKIKCLKELESYVLSELSNHTKNPLQKDDSFCLTNIIKCSVLKLIDELDISLGKTLISHILTGSQSAKIKKLSLDKSFQYNSLSLVRPEAVIEVIIQLILDRYIEEVTNPKSFFTTLSLSNRGLLYIQKGSSKNNIIWKSHQKLFSNNPKSIYPLLKGILHNNCDISLNENILKAISLYKPKNYRELSMIKGINNKNMKNLSNALRQIYSMTNVKHNFQTTQYTQITNSLLNHYFPPINGIFNKGYSFDYYTEPLSASKTHTPVGRAIFKFKYKNKQGLPEIITDKIIQFFDKISQYKNINVITTVPPNENHPSIAPKIAQFIEINFGIKYIPDLLIKISDNVPQKSLHSTFQRKENIRGVYIVNSEIQARNQDILLLDDIFDTGSTLNECSKVLKEAGAKSIYALTCAKTGYR